jgi:hypothetical protein
VHLIILQLLEVVVVGGAHYWFNVLPLFKMQELFLRVVEAVEVEVEETTALLLRDQPNKAVLLQPLLLVVVVALVAEQDQLEGLEGEEAPVHLHLLKLVDQAKMPAQLLLAKVVLEEILLAVVAPAADLVLQERVVGKQHLKALVVVLPDRI